MKTTYTKPPIDILDVLHDAEKNGVELPKCVDDWWLKETDLMQSEISKQIRSKNEKREKSS
jgi:hypothetical protein